MTLDLGAAEKTYKPTALGTFNYLGAALLGSGFGLFLIRWGLTAQHAPHLKQVIGGVLCLGLAVWMAAEFNRLRRLTFTLHTNGMTSSEGARLTWSDIVAIEARYVPGLRKRGTNDERNVVAAWVLTRGQEPVKLPRELGLRELAALLALIAERSGAPVNKVLVANLMQR